MKRNYLFFWFAVLLCLAVPAQSFATVYSGSCGENVNWSLDTETGLLEITGSGVMEGYNSHPNFFEEYRTYSPWYSLRDSITQCRIEEGITNIGRSAFWYCNRLTNINIPEGVTSIASCAFYSCSGLTSIIIPESVTSIGPSAFSCCSGLTSINIPEGVTNIGHAAFYCCYELTNITIPRDLSYITTSGDSNPYTAAFERCKKLTSITWNAISFPDTYMSHLDDNLFSSDIREQITSFTFGKEVEKIPRYICYDMKNLTSITIPESVTSIGYEAFRNCTGLTKVNISDLAAWCSISFEDFSNPLSRAHHLYLNGTEITDLVIPEGVTSIGDYTFSQCTGLTSITIPNSVTSIGSSAFSYCTGLKTVINLSNLNITEGSVDNGYVAYYADKVIKADTQIDDFFFEDRTDGNYLIYYIGNETELTLPENYQGGGYNVGESVFSNYSKLTNITIPESVTSIGSSAFYGCTGLTSITIPNSVTSIGEYAFYDCTGLTSINVDKNNPNYCSQNGVLFTKDMKSIICVPAGKTGDYSIPNSVTSIGDGAFSCCIGLTSVTIPESVTSIGEYAFYVCTGLTSITIPGSVTSIGNYAFRYCTGLTSITIPEGVTSIGGYAFFGCTGLTNITIPNSVTNIGNAAFRNCTGLTSITIPEGVTSIGYYAFESCTGLTSITCRAQEPPVCGNSALDGIDTWDCTLFVPEGAEALYKAADQWKEFFFIEEITGIDTPRTDDGKDTTYDIYDMSGRMVRKAATTTDGLKAGLYIINGRKVLVE